MTNSVFNRDFKKLHKDLKRFDRLGAATHETGRRSVTIGFAVLFLIAVWVFTSIITGNIENRFFVIAAGIIGGYMALNIGANDVANNVGPAVGSKALTMLGALIIASVCEAGGAIIAGGDVVSTIKKGIIDPSLMPSTEVFIWAMMAAMMAAALWINIATYFGAPVSTTHSIVGGVMGVGITAAGFDAVAWPTMGKIAASWVISPVLGGVIAAVFLAFIKFFILKKEDKLSAAKKWVPVLIGILGAAFTMYLTVKGIKKIWKAPVYMVLVFGGAAFAVTYAAVKPYINKKAAALENRRKSVSSLFTVPLIVSAAMLSFAHGANDVANAIGPLAAIVGAVEGGEIVTKAAIPGWVMLVGAVGISAGLVLFGPKLIRTVGEQITKLDQTRAFCVALSAAITVIAASWLGLPVSSTHIAVGGVFGVGFLREYLANKEKGKPAKQIANLHDAKLAKAEKRRLVRRSHLMSIIAAWVITVPLAAILASVIFLGLEATLSN